MNKILIDTSFVVALVNKRDEYHDKALSLSIEFDGAPAIITDSVILEIGNALSRNHKSECINAIEGFFASREVVVIRLEETMFGKAFDLYKQYTDKTWGLVDCISFVVMRENGITDALTHDIHFSQAGFRPLMRETIN